MNRLFLAGYYGYGKFIGRSKRSDSTATVSEWDFIFYTTCRAMRDADTIQRPRYVRLLCTFTGILATESARYEHPLHQQRGACLVMINARMGSPGFLYELGKLTLSPGKTVYLTRGWCMEAPYSTISFSSISSPLLGQM